MSNFLNDLSFEMHDDNGASVRNSSGTDNDNSGNSEQHFYLDLLDEPKIPISQPPINTNGGGNNSGGAATPTMPGSPNGNGNNEDVTVPGSGLQTAGLNVGALTNYFKSHPKIAYPIAVLTVAGIAYSVIKQTK